MTFPFSILIPRLSLLFAHTGRPPTRSCIANAREISSFPELREERMSSSSRLNFRPPIMFSPAMTAPISAEASVGPVPIITTSSFLRLILDLIAASVSSSTG